MDYKKVPALVIPLAERQPALIRQNCLHPNAHHVSRIRSWQKLSLFRRQTDRIRSGQIKSVQKNDFTRSISYQIRPDLIGPFSRQTARRRLAAARRTTGSSGSSGTEKWGRTRFRKHVRTRRRAGRNPTLRRRAAAAVGDGRRRRRGVLSAQRSRRRVRSEIFSPASSGVGGRKRHRMTDLARPFRRFQGPVQEDTPAPGGC